MRETLRRLYALGPGRMLPGRERLRALLASAGDPLTAVPSVLVGGTNGKGRVVAALSAIAAQARPSGAFLKPHLKTIRERWRVNDQPLSEEQFTRFAAQACDLIDEYSAPVSFFEANVLLGALAFRELELKLAIWEVGLGGKEDACNLADPLVSVLTNVQYDHQAVLGHTLAEIARDKAHIARLGRPLILGPARPGWDAAYAEYQPVVAEVCAELGARLVLAPAPPQAEWDAYLAGGAQGLPPDTRAVLSCVLAELERCGCGLPAGAVEAGLSRLHYRGRMEQATLAGAPVLLDAAHNLDGLRWLAQVLKASRPGARYSVVFGCQASHDPAEMLSELREVIAVLVPLEIPVLHPCPRARIEEAAASLGLRVSLPPGLPELAATGALDLSIGETTELDPPDNRTRWIECVQHALYLSRADCPAVICGSIYNLGEILRVFEDGWLS
jgi:dihydrofolate synthase / folylpolyglutamate synthase